MQNELLSTHAALRETHVSGERGRERFVRALNMNRLQDAWEVAAHAQIPEMWEQLAHRAMTHMEIEFAIRVYRFVGDASMVMSLERLEHIEDKNMLAGNILILFERDDCYDMAQELFVRSGRAREALQMRKDLKHWDEAMRLAKEADPSQLDDICREHAAVLEMRGEHDAALEMFSRAVQYSGQSETELERGRAGARCAIRVGDAPRKADGARVAERLSSTRVRGDSRDDQSAHGRGGAVPESRGIREGGEHLRRRQGFPPRETNHGEGLFAEVASPVRAPRRARGNSPKRRRRTNSDGISTASFAYACST